MGGSGVLYGAMCHAFGQAGVKVGVLDLNEEAAQKVADDIVAASGEAVAIRLDVLSKDSLEQARHEAVAKFGRVDILINGAGGNNPQATTSAEQPFFDLPADAIRWVFDLNFMRTLIPQRLTPLSGRTERLKAFCWLKGSGDLVSTSRLE